MKHADFSAGTKRRTLMLIALAAFACLGLLISVGKGSVDIPLTEITGFLLGAGNSPHGQIIYNIRLPRSIVAALVGINLALSGAILQAVMRTTITILQDFFYALRGERGMNFVCILANLHFVVLRFP